MHANDRATSWNERGGHWLIAALAVIAGVTLAIAGSIASASSDATLTYKQTVTKATFSASNVDQLLPGTGFDRICWQLVARGGHHHNWCAQRRSPGSSNWRLSAKSKGVSLVTSPAAATLSIRPPAAGIAPGLYKWSFSISSCPEGATGVTGAAGEADDCNRRIPISGGETIRIHSVLASGCRVRGPAQVAMGARRGKRVALTFDDGPAPDTVQFLRELRKLKVHATFFMIGQQVKGREAVLKEMVRDGHELANHSWNHADLGSGGPAATRQIVDTNRAIERASGFRPCLMRPPYGATSRDLVRRIRALKMTSVLWDVDPQDWRQPGTESIVRTVERQTHAGSIILDHDGGGPRSETLAAVPEYVRALRARGYKFVTLNQLLGYRTTYRLAK